MQLKLGSRGSELALRQAQLVKEALEAAKFGLQVTLHPLTVSGDRKQGSPLAKVSDKREWVRELEEAVIDGEIDLAVHSGKDVPVLIEPGTELCSVLRRECAFDALVLQRSKHNALNSVTDWNSLLEQTAIQRLGTASLRRKAQLYRLLPAVELVDHRGNVPTRLKKLSDNILLDGIVLAAAGLHRLGLQQEISYLFSPTEMLPAINQGILICQFRAEDNHVRDLIKEISDPPTQAAFLAERSCVRVLKADCHSAIGVFATLSSNELTLCCRILSVDGQEILEESVRGSAEEAFSLGEKLAETLLRQGAENLLRIKTNQDSAVRE